MVTLLEKESALNRPGTPPPEIKARQKEHPMVAWREKTSQEKAQSYFSPPYSKVRNLTGNSFNRGRDLFPPVVNEQWTPRLVRVSTTYPSKSPEEDKEEPNQAETTPLAPNIPQIPTMEAVMEDLHKVTRQYLSCPDLVEAAARRQRVLHGDAQGKWRKLLQQS